MIKIEDTGDDDAFESLKVNTEIKMRQGLACQSYL